MSPIKPINSQAITKRGKSGLTSLLAELTESVEATPEEEALAKALEEGDLETVARDGADTLAALRDLARAPDGQAIAAGASATARTLLEGE